MKDEPAVAASQLPAGVRRAPASEPDGHTANFNTCEANSPTRWRRATPRGSRAGAAGATARQRHDRVRDRITGRAVDDAAKHEARGFGRILCGIAGVGTRSPAAALAP